MVVMAILMMGNGADDDDVEEEGEEEEDTGFALPGRLHACQCRRTRKGLSGLVAGVHVKGW